MREKSNPSERHRYETFASRLIIILRVFYFLKKPWFIGFLLVPIVLPTRPCSHDSFIDRALRADLGARLVLEGLVTRYVVLPMRRSLGAFSAIGSNFVFLAFIRGRSSSGGNRLSCPASAETSRKSSGRRSNNG